jgi:dihydrofolate reductase
LLPDARLGAGRGGRAAGVVARASRGLASFEGRSPEFAQTLTQHDLVDEYRLMIDPLIVGGGKRLFRDGYPRKPLRLLEGRVTSTGAILTTYATTPS